MTPICIRLGQGVPVELAVRAAEFAMTPLRHSSTPRNRFASGADIGVEAAVGAAVEELDS
jgi:hypothetical protein